ncbi:MAG: hypothetical protein GQ528_07900, partial [Woeseiaceae bacterium]|nr:hypothetical protein [Woeseiaceae bacterium]
MTLCRGAQRRASATRREASKIGAMHLLIIGLIVLTIVFGPGIWVQRVLAKYSEPADRYSGTGAQLARHLLNKNGLENVKVEQTR